MISADYKKQMQDMAARHQFKEKLPKYHLVQDFLKDESPKSLIDFGCAHGAMINRIKNDFPDILIVDGYDPGVIEYEKFPQQQYDCLVSNDVIEHIEPKYLDSTLIAMNTLFTKSAWLIIACYPAKKILPDGRNAHISLHTPNWWVEKIKETFTASTIEITKTVVHKPGQLEVYFVLRSLSN
jgi:cyclopropane fatty-acyl-phospholipid synthase-like methyltransferase